MIVWMTGKKFAAYGMAMALGTILLAGPVLADTEGSEAEEQTVSADENDVMSSREEATGLGMSYVYSEEMQEAGVLALKSDYTALSHLGIFNIRMENADLYYILVYPEETFLSEAEEDKWSARFLERYPELIYKEETNGEYHYTYLDLTASLEKDSYEESEWKKIEEALPLCEEIADSVEYIDLEISSLTFDSVNLDGEQVTDAIFGEKKLTVLNVWATYCNPCINEMPELAEWEKEMGEDVQLIYLCSDIFSLESENIELANQIADKAGINRKHVIYNLPGTCTDVVMRTTGVPTTYFIDQDGIVLEDYVVGAAVPQYKDIVKKYLGDSNE